MKIRDSNRNVNTLQCSVMGMCLRMDAICVGIDEDGKEFRGDCWGLFFKIKVGTDGEGDA